jgi:hypothetical protein
VAASRGTPSGAHVRRFAHHMTAGQFFPWSLQVIRQAGWPAIALFAFHVIASRGFNAYVRFPSLDIPMHILGGVVIAYFFHRASMAASSHGIIGPFHSVSHTVLVFSLTCSAAVFWEFAEFFSDHLCGTHAQLGLEDTLKDMFLGICGGIVFLIATYFTSLRRESQSTNA